MELDKKAKVQFQNILHLYEPKPAKDRQSVLQCLMLLGINKNNLNLQLQVKSITSAFHCIVAKHYHIHFSYKKIAKY